MQNASVIDGREFAARWLPAWTGNDPERLAAFYAQDTFYSDPAVAGGLRGREALLAYFRKLLRANPDWVWTQREAIPLEGGFLNLWRAEIPVDGQRVVLDGTCLVIVRDGLIARNEVYFDPAPWHAALRERNKRTCIAFYEQMFNDNQPREAMDRYAGATYTQHNPVVPDGKEGFAAYFDRMGAEYPGKKVHIVRAFAEGHFVVLHTRQEWPGDSDWAGIDILRLDPDGKVVEHWDVLQRVPTLSEHGNGMF